MYCYLASQGANREEMMAERGTTSKILLIGVVSFVESMRVLDEVTVRYKQRDNDGQAIWIEVGNSASGIVIQVERFNGETFEIDAALTAEAIWVVAKHLDAR